VDTNKSGTRFINIPAVKNASTVWDYDKKSNGIAVQVNLKLPLL
jgi:hypothetical protein